MSTSNPLQTSIFTNRRRSIHSSVQDDRSFTLSRDTHTWQCLKRIRPFLSSIKNWVPCIVSTIHFSHTIELFYRHETFVPNPFSSSSDSRHSFIRRDGRISMRRADQDQITHSEPIRILHELSLLSINDRKCGAHIQRSDCSIPHAVLNGRETMTDYLQLLD